MSLVTEVTTAIAEAMRQKDAPRLSALRMLKAAFMNKAVEKGHELDDAEARQVVSALVKQRKDSIEQFLAAGRQDLVDKETADLTVLESYLPPAADPALIERAVTEAIAETGATSPKDMGKVMKAAMTKLAGQTIDGKVVNELVRAKLSGA
ncbi:MAG: GatB/YqeY domain-containing protein [Acidobacteria bacterium]|nr:GatB/YqeY domain-containing protein [Acidobacteriota bacterium]